MSNSSTEPKTHTTDDRLERLPRYFDAAQFIENCYSKAFNARINPDFPSLMCVTDAAHRILAVAGIRDYQTPFFSEYYFERPAEQTLTAFHGEHVDRQHIVEIGNLAGSGDTRATYFLLHALWTHMIESQYQFLLITCTQRLSRRFAQLPVHKVTRANPIRVPQSAQWGSYYAKDPVVLTGRLCDYDFRFDRQAYKNNYTLTLLHREGQA